MGRKATVIFMMYNIQPYLFVQPSCICTRQYIPDLQSKLCIACTKDTTISTYHTLYRCTKDLREPYLRRSQCLGYKEYN